MKKLVPMLIAFLPLASCAPSRSGEEAEMPTIEKVWIRRPALSGRPGAAYFTFHGGGENARLTGVFSRAARRIELHDGRMEGGVMRMTPLREIEIPTGETVVFEPGGRHAMLFEMSDTVLTESRPTLVFRFSNGRNVNGEAFVLAPNDPPPRFVRESGSCRGRIERRPTEVVITECAP